jgi:hypothetical protein
VAANPSYQPLIGSRLTRFTVEKCILELRFKHDKNETIIVLWTIAGVCLSEDMLFKDHSEYDTYDSSILKTIYGFLEQSVVDFTPLNRSRACKLSFEDGSLYFWADKKELPKPLIEAKSYAGDKEPEHWDIDDV